jgi:Secretion system C-terminal sorting domain/SprB repeat
LELIKLTLYLIRNQLLIPYAMKAKLYLFLSAFICSYFAKAQLAAIPITVEMTPHYGVYEEGAPVCAPIDLTGYVTYDVYINLLDEADCLQAVFGSDPVGADPFNCEADNLDLSIEVPCGVFQHPLGGKFATDLNCDMYSLYEALQWDSFLTIGATCSSDGTEFSYLSWPCDQLDFDLFEGPQNCDYFDGGGFRMDSNAIFNVNGHLAGSDHKILIARITSCGDVCLNFGVQLLDNCTPGQPIQYFADDLGICQLHPCNNFPMTAHTVSNDICSGNSSNVVFQEGGYGYVNYNVHSAATNEIVDVHQFVNGEFSLNSLSAGEYYVSMIDSVGCRDTSSVFMVQAPEALSLQANIQEEISCAGESDGSIQLACSGGEMPYTLWHTYEDGIAVEVECGSLIENLSCGIHMFELSDSHGCSVSTSVDLVCPSQIQIDLTHQSISCFDAMDGFVAGEAMGGTGNLNVTWSPSDNFPTYPENQNPVTLDAAGLPAGVYFLVIEDDHLCQQSMEVEITEPEPLLCSIELTDNDACASVNGGTPGYSFQWSDGSTGNCIENMEPGIYTVDVFDENGCTVSSSVEYTVGVAEMETDQISIYPNPVIEYLYIETSMLTSDFSEIEILDMDGRIVQKNIRLTENGINVSELATGVYSIRLHTGERVHSLSFVKL